MKAASLPDQALGVRASLPADLPILLADYPREGWRTHPDLGQMAALWLHVHESHSNEGRMLLRAVDAFRQGQIAASTFPQLFVPAVNRFVGNLHAHHSIEDQSHFPKFKQIDERMIAGFDLLGADHGVIDEALGTMVSGARQLLHALDGPPAGLMSSATIHAGQIRQLNTLLDQHLADEEELVIPALLKYGDHWLY
jgi:iron-sulfur cluster repair protein YtfE (RIC family)